MMGRKAEQAPAGRGDRPRGPGVGGGPILLLPWGWRWAAWASLGPGSTGPDPRPPAEKHGMLVGLSRCVSEQFVGFSQ